MYDGTITPYTNPRNIIPSIDINVANEWVNISLILNMKRFSGNNTYYLYRVFTYAADITTQKRCNTVVASERKHVPSKILEPLLFETMKMYYNDNNDAR